MNYIIKGKVIKGNGYGRKIGFPTINLDRRNFLKLKDKPAFGVYAGIAELAPQIAPKALSGALKYRAGIVIGPLDKKGLPKIEAHLIGFKGNLYDKKVVLHLERFLRKFKKFKTEKELIKQIGKDLEKC